MFWPPQHLPHPPHPVWQSLFFYLPQVELFRWKEYKDISTQCSEGYFSDVVSCTELSSKRADSTCDEGTKWHKMTCWIAVEYSYIIIVCYIISIAHLALSLLISGIMLDYTWHEKNWVQKIIWTQKTKILQVKYPVSWTIIQRRKKNADHFYLSVVKYVLIFFPSVLKYDAKTEI